MKVNGAPELVNKEGRWNGWRPGEFQVHMIHTGVGESVFLIFPDGTSMLIDSGDHPAVAREELAVPVLPSPNRMAGYWVARYIQRVNPRQSDVDYMMVSHWHTDHAGSDAWRRGVAGTPDGKLLYSQSGFVCTMEKINFTKAFDRMYPECNVPVDYNTYAWPPDTFAHLKSLYAYMISEKGLKVEKFRLGATDQIVPLHGPCKDFEIRNVCANCCIALPDGTVKNLYQKYLDLEKPEGYLNENAMSLGMVISYGPFRLMTCGDFSAGCFRDEKGYCYEGGIEDDLADTVGKVDVAKLNHHGYMAMPPKLISTIQARVYLAGVWDQLHMTSDTMATVTDRTLYAGPRTIFPTVMTEERRKQDAELAWLKDVAKETNIGTHVVVTVPEGGKTYSVTCIDARDEEMKVVANYGFETTDK